MEFSTGQDGSGEARGPLKAALRTAAIAVGILLAVFGVAWTSMQTQDMLTRDTRFQIAGVEESGSITVTGVRRASPRAVLKAFDQDAGKSIIEVDPEARRLKLRTVEWVRDATVRRVWPNRLHVDVVEREPVAFLPVASAMTGRFNNPVSYQPMLIDEDGAVMSIRGAVPQNLPLLIGVRRDEDIERRRTGVRWMLRVLDELKEYRSQIVEVDVSNRDSLRVGLQMQDGVVILILGSERFLERVRTFHNHYEGIRDRLSPRALLDVSLEGRITAIPVADTTNR
jgi:cell division protein FtsQ